MLVQYISAALCHAQYERLPFGWLGYIPEFESLWVLEDTRVKCEQELADTLENWLLASRERGLPIPTIDGIDLEAFWTSKARST